MSTITSSTTMIESPFERAAFEEAQLAAASFLARYSGRTLEAYRHDLRGFFQWATDTGLDVLAATRGHIELFRSWMEQRGLAASTIDRRLSTVCGFYRFAHIDGRIASNPAQYVRRPQLHPSDLRGLDRSELGVFLFTAEQYDRHHAAPAVLLGLNGLRVSEACATRRATSRPANRAPLGAFDRQTSRTRPRSSAHAASRVHHGRTRRWCPAPRCTDRGSPRRPTYHHDLRPAPSELRPPRRVRRRRVRGRRLTLGVPLNT